MAKAIISTAIDGGTVIEGHEAIITYHLSVALSSATTVSASVGGSGITAGDYSGFQYRMGNDALALGWKTVPVGGVITLNSGFSDFQLMVNVTDDHVVEKWDALTFVVAQTAQTVGIEGSWYVASTVALRDVDASLADATITLSSTSPHTATEAAELGTTGTASDSNHAAYALYDLSVAGGGGLSAATTLNAAVYGEGATAGSDYRYLQYRASTSGSPDHAVSNNWTSWTAVTSGQISLGVGTKHFELATSVPTDNVVETWESLTFTVGQTAASSHIENSWYVGSRVALHDAGSTLPNATITLATASPLTATEAIDTAHNANKAAYALYDVSVAGGGGLSVATTLNAAVYGVGATAGTDYGALQYRALTGSTWSGWSSVPAGQISLTQGVKQFELSTDVLADSIEETWESLIFAVSQTTASSHIENSWYVASNVALQDPDGALTVNVTDDVPGFVNIANTNVAYTYTFNRPVTGLDINDFGFTNGTIQSITPGPTVNTTTYTVNVLSADVASGNISLVLRQGAVFDADGNTNLISTEASQAIDRLAPDPAGQAVTFSGDHNNTINLDEANNGFVISGTKATDATVTLGGKTSTAADSTHWSVMLDAATIINTYGQGTETLTVVSTDAAGNATSLPSVLLNVDTVPPLPVSQLRYSGNLDNTISPAEAAAGFTISGTKASDATVSLNGLIAVAETTTTWHVLLNPTAIAGLHQGTNGLTLVSTDAAGNTTPTAVNLTVDTVPPVAAVVTAYSGNNDSTINAAEAAAGFTISGTNEAGATVTLAGQTVVPGAGPNPTTWSVVLSPTTITQYTEGPNTLTVVSTDVAGSTPTTVNLTVDRMAPAAVANITYSGTGDPTISTAEAAAGFTISGAKTSDATVTLAGQTVVADTDTTWHVLLNQATIATYGQGLETLTVVSTDAAGNATNTAVNLTVQTVVPGAAVVTAYSGSHDSTINAAEAAAGFAISGTNDVGATVTLGGQAVTVDSPTTWHMNLTSTTIANYGQGDEVLSLVSTNAAGSTTSSTVNLFVDTVAPAAAAGITYPAGNLDSIISPAEAVAGFTIAGNNELGATVTLAGQTVVADTATTWHVMLNKATIDTYGQGPETLTVVSTDAAGNASNAAVNLTVQTVVPGAAAVTAFSGNLDSTINLAEANAGFVISGTNDAGATVTLGGQAVAVDSPTTWHMNLTSTTIATYGQGDEVLSLVSTNAAGSTTSSTVNLFVDTVAPGTAVVTAYSGNNDSIINPAEAAAAFFRISGTKATDATVTLTGQTVVADATTWHVDLSSDTILGYGEGSEVLTLVSTDAAGNASNTTVNLTVDTVPPVAAVVSTYSGDHNSTINAAEAAAGFAISGTNEAGATVALTGQTVVADTATTWHVTLGQAMIAGYGQDGETLTLVSTDAAGNASNTTVSLTVDTVAPVAAAVTGYSGGDNFINAAELVAPFFFTISGTNEAGATVTLAGQNVVADTGTTWHVLLTQAAITGDGVRALTVVSTDAAGNATNTPVSLTVDTGAPVAAAVTGYSGDSNSTINAAEANALGGFIISGTNELGATVKLGGQTATIAPDGTHWSVALTKATIDAYNQTPQTLTLVSTDAAGNTTNSALVNLTVDTVPPVAAAATGYSGGDRTINLAEATAVGGFTISGTNELGATVALGGQAATIAPDGTHWSVTLSPTTISHYTEGLNTLPLVSTDAAGNATNTTVDLTVDRIAPTVTLNIVDNSLSDAHNSSVLTIAFSEAPFDFADTDISPTSGTISGLAGAGLSYNATFTATDGLNAIGSVAVNAGTFTDAAGNPNVAAVPDTVAIHTAGNALFVALDAVVDSTHFQTIQAAINAAATGDTILVAAGPYNEFVDVTNAVTLVGAQAGLAGSAHTGAESVITGGMYISADNVIVDGFKLTGAFDPDLNDANNYYGAVVVKGANDTFQNSVIDGTSIALPHATNFGVDSWTSQTGMHITNNAISGYNYGVYQEVGGTGTVDHNVFNANGSGVFAGSAPLTISDNTFTNSAGAHIIDQVLATEDLNTNIGANTFDAGSQAPIKLLLGGDIVVTGTDYAETFVGTYAGVFSITGGGGSDTISFQWAGAGVTINLTAGTAAAGSFTSIENARGGDGNDTITGTTGDNVITGGAGGDALTGFGGNDTFVFTAGSSIAVAGSFDSIMDLSSGDKIAVPGAVVGTRVVLDGGTFTDVNAWIASLTPTYGTSGGTDFAVGQLHVYRTVSDAYLWINTDGNGQFNVATDTFIKLVGAAGMTNDALAAVLI